MLFYQISLPFHSILRKENGNAKESPIKTKDEKKSLIENLKGKIQCTKTAFISYWRRQRYHID